MYTELSTKTVFLIYNKVKRHKVSQVRQRPKNISNKNKFKTRILNKYFSVSTWKSVK